jgi:uncharacterized protein (TIGR00255 family)
MHYNGLKPNAKQTLMANHIIKGLKCTKPQKDTPMTLSMTAFARTDLQTELGSYSWEIRTVNSRYLELHFRLPDSMRSIEAELRDHIRQTLSRGKVECTLKFTSNQTQQNLVINADLVTQISEAADQVHGIIGPGNALSSLDILKWPGVISQGSTDYQQAGKEALLSFKDTLSQLIEMRGREGLALKTFIEQRITDIHQQTDAVSKLLPEILTAQRDHLNTKLKELTINVDPDRFEQEMMILLQKSDVDEELDRLNAHLAEITRTLNQAGPVGRRLDFMMQELNREANTLSSKSISHITTHIAVELKVLIEQMREQIQNIE